MVGADPGRSEVFKNSADSYLEVHHTGAHDADVTEGSGILALERSPWLEAISWGHVGTVAFSIC